MKIDLILLAAGFSHRFPGNKLLYPFLGKPMIEHVIQSVLPVGFHRIYVVTQYEEIITRLQDYPLTCLFHEHPEYGMSSSMQLAIKAATQDHHSALMFLNADMPLLSTASLLHLCQQADTTHIIAATNDDLIQNPMIFPNCYEAELLQLQGDRGGKQIAYRHEDALIKVKVPKWELQDFDTMEAIQQWQQTYEKVTIDHDGMTSHKK